MPSNLGDCCPTLWCFVSLHARLALWCCVWFLAGDLARHDRIPWWTLRYAGCSLFASGQKPPAQGLYDGWPCSAQGSTACLSCRYWRFDSSYFYEHRLALDSTLSLAWMGSFVLARLNFSVGSKEPTLFGKLEFPNRGKLACHWVLPRPCWQCFYKLPP